MFCLWKSLRRRAGKDDRAIRVHAAVLVGRSRVSSSPVVTPAWRAECGSVPPSFSPTPDKKETHHVS